MAKSKNAKVDMEFLEGYVMNLFHKGKSLDFIADKSGWCRKTVVDTIIKHQQKEMVTPRDSEILCPYYIWRYIEKSGCITLRCEGSDGASKIEVSYRKASALKEMMEKYCCDKWQDCPIAGMVTEKYDRIGD